MFHHDHVKKVLFLIFSCFSFSCENTQKKANNTAIYSQYLRTSENVIGKGEYYLIREMAVDTLNSWINRKIDFWQYEKIGYTVKIDSLICFNKERNKLITVLLAKTLNKNSSIDGVHFFYGVKIKEKWYFFSGPTMYIPRNKDSLQTPTSFTKLHKIAMQEIFSGYLIKDSRGQCQINEHFFDDLTSNAWWADGKEPKNQEEWDKRYLEIVKENRAKIDTNDYSKSK